ncbi:MAG: cytochrome P450 [Pseudanabaenaceae cyanobacterium bins.39]|nr:cytochrome P450 [Pseudanabaenaceae cyanobacterium bins.39]
MSYLSTTQFLATTALPVIIPLAVILLLAWRIVAKQRHFQALQSLPSPPKNWLLGNIPMILAAVKQKRFFQLLFDWSRQYGSAYVYWAGDPVIVLSNPVTIDNTIINGTRDGSLIRSRTTSQAWNDISGPILLGQSGAEWQWRRKAWNPEFSSTGLSPYWELVHQICSDVTDKIKQQTAISLSRQESTAIAVDQLFVELTMRVICGLLLGLSDSDRQNSTNKPALDVAKIYKATAVISYRFLRVATGEQTWRKYLPTKSARDYWNARADLESFLAPYIDEVLQMRDNPQGSQSQDSSLKNSMLFKIAAKEPRYTKEYLMAESVELLIAGTDTTAHTLSFAMGELASHREVFRKAQQLVDEVWQKYGGISLESLKELNYLRAIIKEVLRLYSIASGSTGLQVVRPMQIESITAPVGTKIFWSMLAAGRDASIYENPEQFTPERWLNEGSPSLPMIDFGSGAHRCLGENLSMLEATIILAQLLRNFDWELVNGRSSLENLQQNLLIYPVDGMPLKFIPRHI